MFRGSFFETGGRGERVAGERVAGKKGWPGWMEKGGRDGKEWSGYEEGRQEG